MESIFLEFVNMSVTASWVIAVVLLLRLLLRPVPKMVVCLLWLVVLFRLLCPISLEAGFSLVPQHQTIQPEVVYTTPKIVSQSNVVNEIVDQTVNPILENTSAPTPYNSVNPLQVYLFVASWIWMLGAGALCIYTFFSWYRLRKRLTEAVPETSGIYLCDQITSPFVFGIMQPKIYLPYGLSEEEQRCVLLHERGHIARWDFLWKPLFWLAVMLHWMNPLVWVAWHYYSRDLELACDERAITAMDGSQKQRYSNTLLQLAVQQRGWNCPVAFGNNSTRQRIQHVLRYKQKAVWIAVVALVITLMMIVALGANPVQVYSLGDLRQELAEPWPDVSSVEMQWGSVTVQIEDQAQIAQLRQQLAGLQVQKKGKVSDHLVTIEPLTGMNQNVIQFFDADHTVLESVYLSGDCSRIAPKDTAKENCAYLKVSEPESLVDTFLQYGKAAREQLGDTTFFADLNHDGVEEQIVINPTHWQEQNMVRFAVYQEKGIVNYAVTLAGDSNRWDTYYLYQQDGKSFLLQYTPGMDQDDYGNYCWQLLQFDKKGQPTVVKENKIEFSVNREQYQFDAQAIYDFLKELDDMLQDAILLVSTENGTLQYSTTKQQLCPLAESYISWLDDVHVDVPLLEKLQQKQNILEFDGPLVALEQWLKYHRDFDWSQQELLAPKLVTIDGKRCVSFELHWKENQLAGDNFIGAYALSTQDSDDSKAKLNGRCYYQFDQTNDKWVLLQDDSKQSDLAQVADRWAQTFGDRDGIGRYSLMDATLQKQIDTYSEDDDFALWMPIWVTNEDGSRSKGMFLRGSSPWVDSYQIEIHQPDGTEKADFAQNTSILITYDMTDSTQEHYVYQEVLTVVQEKENWRVASCTITVDELGAEIYQQAQEILNNLQDGHETWRLDPEQVAFAFVHDYLELSDGSMSQWNAGENSFVYTSANGTAYTIHLYQPIIRPYDAADDFWAVEEYSFTDTENGAQFHNLQFDSWASLHIR